MLKKFVSNALLSVVMDKTARKNLAERQALKSPAPPEPPSKGQTPSSDEDILSTISDALAEARAEVDRDAPANGSRNQHKRFEPTPPPRKSPGKAKAASPDRAELIKQAMSIHQQKQQILDDLPTETREKLMVMAMYAMDPGSLPPEERRMAEAELAAEKGSSGGQVDDIGSAAKPRRRKRK